MTGPKENWCEEFFDDLFAEQHLVRNDIRETEAVVSFLEEKLHLKASQRIFDQCCGVGSLSHVMAAKGYIMHGMDLIPSYIDRARRDAGRLGIDAIFEAGDAHIYVTPVACDAAFNWWTSFGYTPDDTQNIKMIACVAKSLKSGGWFALDYMNGPQRLEEFKGREVSISELKKGETSSIWESRLDAEKGMIVKKWKYTGKDGKTIEKQGGGAKVYFRSDLEKMFSACGFKDISFYGSVAGEALTDSSPRCIVVARKE